MMEQGRKVNPVQIQKFLKGISYPASKQELVSHARMQEAPENIVYALEMLPEQEFQTPSEVSKAVAKM